jgi:hypothetical protein
VTTRLAVPLVLAVLVALALGAGVVLTAGPGSAAGANRAGLVVVFPEGAQTYWVDFPEPEISGAQLLERAGLDVTFAAFGGLGGAVCAIDGVGCTNPGDCWCQCKSGSCHYWAYFKLDGDGDWAVQTVGASTRKLRDGDVDGWAWGAGAPPPEMMTAVPCPTPDPPPSAGRTPTAAPQSSSSGGSTSGGSGQSAASGDDAAPPPASTPAPASPPDAAGRAVTPTPAPTPGPGDALRRIEGVEPPDGAGQAVAGRSEAPESDDGAPTSAIAFGAVAAAMALGVGAVAARRRLRG